MYMPFCEFDEECTKFAIRAKHVSCVKLTGVSMAFQGHQDYGNVAFSYFRLLCGIVTTNRN